MGEEVAPQGQGEMPNNSDEMSDVATPATIEEAAKEIARLRAALKRTNAEAASHRMKAKELEEYKGKVENEQLTEKQRLEKQLSEIQNQHTELLRQHQERSVQYEVKLQAAQLGVKYPEKVSRLLDWSEIEYDDSGNPTNISKLV